MHRMIATKLRLYAATVLGTWVLICMMATNAFADLPAPVKPRYDNGVASTEQRVIQALCGWGVLLCIAAAIVSTITLVWANSRNHDVGARHAQRGIVLGIVGAAVLAGGDAVFLTLSNYAGTLLPT